MLLLLQALCFLTQSRGRSKLPHWRSDLVLVLAAFVISFSFFTFLTAMPDPGWFGLAFLRARDHIDNVCELELTGRETVLATGTSLFLHGLISTHVVLRRR